MLKLRNSNTHIPQYETWAGTNDGLVTEAALLRAPTQEISLPVLLDTGHGITQIQSGPIQRFQLSHTAHNARPAAGQHWSSPTMQQAAELGQGWGWGWSHPFIAFFPVVLNIWILSMAVFSKTDFDRETGSQAGGQWPAAAATLKTGREKRKSFIQFQKQNYSKSILWVYLHVIWLSRGLGTGDSSW